MSLERCRDAALRALAAADAGAARAISRAVLEETLR
jgi:hypothetical protein